MTLSNELRVTLLSTRGQHGMPLPVVLIAPLCTPSGNSGTWCSLCGDGRRLFARENETLKSVPHLRFKHGTGPPPTTVEVI